MRRGVSTFPSLPPSPSLEKEEKEEKRFHCCCCCCSRQDEEGREEEVKGPRNRITATTVAIQACKIPTTPNDQTALSFFFKEEEEKEGGREEGGFSLAEEEEEAVFFSIFSFLREEGDEDAMEEGVGVSRYTNQKKRTKLMVKRK